MDEDFERALECKKEIAALNKKQLTAESLRQGWLSDAPILPLRKIFEKLATLDQNYAERALTKMGDPWSHPNPSNLEASLLNDLIVLAMLTKIGHKKFLDTSEDLLQVVITQTNLADVAKKAIAFELDDLTQEEMQQFREDPKVENLIQGLKVINVAMKLLVKTLEVCEQLDTAY